MMLFSLGLREECGFNRLPSVFYCTLTRRAMRWRVLYNCVDCTVIET